MNELREIAGTLAREQARGEFVLATLVRLRGSGYRRPGARMLVARDGTCRGFVSGGCLEADVAERARCVIDTAVPDLVTYDTRAAEDDVWGLGMGCNGIVDVLLEPVPHERDPAHPANLLANLRSRRRGALLTIVASAGPGAPPRAAHAWVDDDDAVSEARWKNLARPAALAALEQERSTTIRIDLDDRSWVDVFVEPFTPPVRLIVAGAGPDAPPLVAIAHGLGWSVVVCDPRPAFADPSRFAKTRDVEVICCEPEDVASRIPIDERSAVVIMTHHFERDRRLLRALLPTRAAYVGILGPRRRTRDLLDRLAERDGFLADDAMRSRLYGPVGLDLGSASPEEIALSIAAEVRAVLSGRTGGSLREREGPIYDRPKA